ncbi:LysR family transcriptional regulator [Sphingomonas quercus]|uniref:LysR family transcriptional regulator n=1 Tax=Sphingomonas quercus TaxID=2842451 RepID=A0ABS6BG55_9SPHN|nr:LysR family transcriptional regulator [Sphingomonas quercus]MBU3076811.1 LysR family transcriptional regulator [Sphingomonas quercus]
MTAVYSLNLRHLRMLRIIADSRSLSTAARAVAISQPALTQALAKMETAFGTAVFHRTAQGVAPTSGGRRLIQRVSRSLDAFGVACRRAAKPVNSQKLEAWLTMSHVRGLIALAEAGSFLKAAEEAGVSVPSLHRAVRDLEALAGVRLVERRGRGMGLSRTGARLARGFMIATAELAAALEETASGGQRLSIGAMALSRSLLLPASLADLLQRRPDIHVDVIEGSFLELVELLRNGRIDVLIGALREHPPRDLVQEALFTDALTIIGRAEHPLAGRVADFTELAAYPWIVARRASGLLDQWQQMFDRSGATRPTAPIQCGSVALIRGILVRSDFLTLLSTDQVRAEIESGTLVTIASCVPDTQRTIGVITRRDWFPTRLQEEFMATLKLTGSESTSAKMS